MSKVKMSFGALLIATACCASQAHELTEPGAAAMGHNDRTHEVTNITNLEWLGAVATAQAPVMVQAGPECSGRIYSPIEIPSDQRAKITSKPIPNMTPDALRHDVHGRVVLEAVLCRTGKVTDVRVIAGLPYGMTETAIQAAMAVKFTPAEMKWHSVSQKQRFEYGFNERGTSTSLREAVGQIVEAVELIGNRRLTAREVMQHVKTRPGEPLDPQQVQRDLGAILATGHFDATVTRVSAETGLRGGLVIIFEVQELPLITEVKFEGFDEAASSSMLEDLRKEHIDLRNGAVYDPGKIKIAIERIRRILESNGQGSVKVEVRTENHTGFDVSLTFIISRQ